MVAVPWGTKCDVIALSTMWCCLAGAPSDGTTVVPMAEIRIIQWRRAWSGVSLRVKLSAVNVVLTPSSNHETIGVRLPRDETRVTSPTRKRVLFVNVRRFLVESVNEKEIYVEYSVLRVSTHCRIISGFCVHKSWTDNLNNVSTHCRNTSGFCVHQSTTDDLTWTTFVF